MYDDKERRNKWNGRGKRTARYTILMDQSRALSVHSKTSRVELLGAVFLANYVYIMVETARDETNAGVSERRLRDSGAGTATTQDRALRDY